MKKTSKKQPEDDDDAFRSLFETFFPKIRAMLIRQGTDHGTAEDIAQDTLFTVWHKKQQYSKDRGSVAAWIYSIARNLRIDRVRKQAVWQRYQAELELGIRLVGEAGSNEGKLGDRYDVETVLQELPPEQLQIVVLSFVEGLSQKEIAQKLEIPLGTVKSRMRLAFGKLASRAGSER